LSRLEDYNKMTLKINKVLFITSSNMGDVILALPVLDYLRENFPAAKITAMIGPRPKEILQDNPHIDRLIIYDKYSRLREKIKLFQELEKERFDLIIDLRNTFYGAFLPARYRTSPFLYIPGHIQHMKDRNLYRLQMALASRKPLAIKQARLFYSGSVEDENYINCLLKDNGINSENKIILVSPGTGGDTRRWDSQKFTRLCAALSRDYKVVLIGSEPHRPITQYIYQNCPNKIFDFTGKTTLGQFARLLKKSVLLVTCDTGTLQLASYLDTPIVALFGPSDERKYGPWSNNYRIVTKDIFCRPCKKAHCRFKTVECMSLIKVEDVSRQIRDILVTDTRYPIAYSRGNFKRILITRTDRIGDVMLSTPVIKALRENYPNAYIAMMVSPYAKDVVEGNPYLDEVITYDKDGKHKSWGRSIKLGRNLKKKKFDLALILHPSNRAHLLTFLAGIPKRVGYDIKLGSLLTDRIKHTKQFGEKHELEYNLDLLRYLSIEPEDKSLFMPIRPESEKYVEGLFREEGIKNSDRLLAIHPGASCPSKVWPSERFAEAADRLAEKYGFKVLVVAGPKDTALAQNVIKRMRHPVLNLAGRISVSQLASVLKRCRLFISNDSGPVHISSALGTPVISIFGRSQKGLSPKRWGPLGEEDRVVSKTAGCVECLAHNCTRSFACLKAVSADYVVSVADSILAKDAL